MTEPRYKVDDELYVAGTVYRILYPLPDRPSPVQKIVDWVAQGVKNTHDFIITLQALSIVEKEDWESLRRGLRCSYTEENRRTLLGWGAMNSVFREIDITNGQSVDNNI